MKVITEEPEEEKEKEAVVVVECTEKRVEEDLQPICHGWLIVCEGDPEKMMNQEVNLPWHAGYCVFDPRQSTMSCYKHEYPYVANRMIHRNNTVRLDGGRIAFAKHWGLLPDRHGSPMTGSHTIARSYTRPPKERIPTKERFFSISRIPSRFTKFSTVRALPIEYLERLFCLFSSVLFCSIAQEDGRRGRTASEEERKVFGKEREGGEAGRIVIGRDTPVLPKAIPSTSSTQSSPSPPPSTPPPPRHHLAATSSTLKPRSPIERRVSASSHSSTGSMHRSQGVHPNSLHHLLLANKKRSNTTTCAQSTPSSTPRSSRNSAYSSGSTTSSLPLYVNTQAELQPKAEKRVSFKDLDMSGRLPATTNSTSQQPSSSFSHLRTGGGLHSRKLHRCDTGDMSLLERYLSRENMHTPSPIPSDYHQQNYSPRHVHFAQNQSRRPFQRDQRDENSSIRKRLSRSCDHLNDHNFSPRLPPIRRRPTRHTPSALSLVIHGTLFRFFLYKLYSCNRTEDLYM